MCAFGRAIATDVTESREQLPGKMLFENNCSRCHDRGIRGAPIKSLLMQMTPTSIYNVLTRGAMQVQASQLSDQGRRQIVEYLTGRSAIESNNVPLLMCRKDESWFDPNATPVGTGWGIDAENTRSIPAAQAGLTAEDLHKLKLRWAFAFSESIDVRSQPLVVGNVLFVGSQSGTVYAMDARTGCVHWTFQATGEIRSALVYRKELTVSTGRGEVNPTLFFDDLFAYVYAIDAATGSLLWKVRIDDHAFARTAGTPVLWKDRVYVPVSSWGEGGAGVSDEYPCCTFRGSLVALDRLTGATVWKRYTIPTPAVEQYRNSSGRPQFGPSGAGVWSSPAIDEKRGSLYFTTGNNYSDPSDDNSDAIFSIELTTGEVKWMRQTLANDTYNDGCKEQNMSTCPKKAGPDVDFTAPPILTHGKSGKDILIAGQKSGDAFGLDPDTGKILWRNRISQDPAPMSGGIWFGMVVQNEKVFIPIMGTVENPTLAPWSGTTDQWYQWLKPSPVNGLYAVSAFTGKLLWTAPVESYCEKRTPCAGIKMAPIAIPGAVFTGSFDGYIRAFDSRTGKVLWSFNTSQEFRSLNGDLATGGAITGAGGVMVANGMVYVNSSRWGKPNSALLAFSIK